MIIYDDSSMSVTNTTGTLMIAKLAESYKIPVYIFAEESKIFLPTSASKIATGATHPIAEENLFDEKDFLFRELVRSRKVTYFNPGYDDIHSSEVPFILITEKRTFDFSRTDNAKLEKSS